MQILNQQAIAKNPILNALRNGVNPKQIVMDMFNRQLGNKSPVLQQMIDMANSGNSKGLESYARQIFQQNGRSFDTEYQNFKNSFQKS